MTTNRLNYSILTKLVTSEKNVFKSGNDVGRLWS